MSTIRPNLPSYTPPQPQGDARRSAAQAFFALAGQRPTQGPPQAPAAPEVPAVAAPQPARAAAVDGPQKILRPGSLIDIRV